jgi:hypothetical protein
MSDQEKDNSIMLPLSRRNVLAMGSALGGAAMARVIANAQMVTNTRAAEKNRSASDRGNLYLSAAEIESIPAEKMEIIAA